MVDFGQDQAYTMNGDFRKQAGAQTLRSRLRFFFAKDHGQTQIYLPSSREFLWTYRASRN